MSSLPERENVMNLVAESVRAGARQARACAVIALSERTLQRWQNDRLAGVGDRRPARAQAPGNALSESERQRVLAVANSEEFGHLPPSQIVPRLADRGEYLASESTIYRILKAHDQLAHRRAEKPSKPRTKPRALSATGPNQLFSWDITYLPTLVKGSYFYLYLFLDIFSRKIVGWQVYDAECSELASAVMRDICARERIAPNQVVLHSDNGSPMKGAMMLATLQTLGVVPSFSRPAVSNDNAYSESAFKTMKYRPNYPTRPFADLVAARQWIDSFVHWYNEQHRHSAIGFVTPGQRHAGQDIELLRQRDAIYAAAKAANPNRWSGATRNWKPVTVVHLNPEKEIPVIKKMEDNGHALKEAA
jgi:putative transposase